MLIRGTSIRPTVTVASGSCGTPLLVTLACSSLELSGRTAVLRVGIACSFSIYLLICSFCGPKMDTIGRLVWRVKRTAGLAHLQIVLDICRGYRDYHA